LLYSHDSYGLGHIRRNLALAKGIVRQDANARVVIVTGSPRADAFELPERTRCVRLPSVTKNATGRYVPRESGVSLQDVIERRTRTLQDTVQDFEPDLILVDHTPQGLCGELIPVLERSRRTHPERAVVLGMRDIYDAPAIVRPRWERDGTLAALESTYERVLVYGQRAVFSPVDEYGFTPRLRARTSFVGYVDGQEPAREPEAVRARHGRPEQPLVLVTVGGGGDGEHVVRGYLRDLERLGERCGWRSLVVTGPLMSAAGRAAAHAATAQLAGVDVLEFTPRLVDCMEAADAVVSMGGYNSTVELLSRDKRMVCVPRVFPRQEQLTRAQRLSGLGLLRMITPAALQPGALTRHVQAALAAPAPRARRVLDFGGVETAARTLKGLLGGRKLARGASAILNLRAA
jgi:predicted glycosyltransferase